MKTWTEAERKSLKERYEKARIRDIRNVQVGGEFSRKQTYAHGDSYLFLGKIFGIGKNSSWHGSVSLCQFKDKKYFVTNSHLIMGDLGDPDQVKEKIEDCHIHVFIQNKISGKGIHILATDFKCDTKLDLAAVEVKAELKTDLVLNHVATKISKGDTVEAYGYPSGNFLYSSGAVIFVTDANIRHTANIYKGSSGGPIVINKGREKFLGGIVASMPPVGYQNIENFLESRSYTPDSDAVSYQAVANFLLSKF